MNDCNEAKQNEPTALYQIKFAKRSFLLISSSILRIGVQFVVIFLYARNLTLNEYGFYQSVWLYINIASVVSLFGLPSLLLSGAVINIKNWIRWHKKSFFQIACVLNLVPLIYIFIFANNFDLITKCLLGLLIVVQNIAIITEVLTIKKEQEFLVLLSNIIFITGYFLWHIILLYNNYSLQLLLVGLTFMFVIKLFLQWYFSKGIIKEETDKDSFRGKQWFYMGLYEVTGVIAKWLDKWLILTFISVTQFATYFNGAYEIPVFGLMVSAVGNIMLVEFSKQGNGTAATVKILFEKSSRLLSAIVFPSFCFLFFYHDEFFTLIFSAKYAEAIPIFLISIFVLPLRITNAAAALQVHHRNDLILKGSLLDLLITVLLMLVLYPIFNLRGLALAFVIATYVQIGYYLWHTGKLIKKKVSWFFPYKKLFVTMGVSFAVTGAGYFIFINILHPFNIAGGIVLCLLTSTVFLFNYYKVNRQGSGE